MTVHRDRFLVNKTNKCTEFHFYWYHDSTCFRKSFCPPSGVLSRISALVQFMQFGGRVLPGAGWKFDNRILPWSRMELCWPCTTVEQDGTLVTVYYRGAGWNFGDRVLPWSRMELW